MSAVVAGAGAIALPLVLLGIPGIRRDDGNGAVHTGMNVAVEGVHAFCAENAVDVRVAVDARYVGGSPGGIVVEVDVMAYGAEGEGHSAAGRNRDLCGRECDLWCGIYRRGRGWRRRSGGSGRLCQPA